MQRYRFARLYRRVPPFPFSSRERMGTAVAAEGLGACGRKSSGAYYIILPPPPHRILAHSTRELDFQCYKLTILTKSKCPIEIN